MTKPSSSCQRTNFSVAEHNQFLRYKRLIVFDKFTREFGCEVEKRGLSEEQLMTELEETKREVFQERYGDTEVGSSSG